jgi:alpha-tubulin suppressor-like RCC1 family protein
MMCIRVQPNESDENGIGGHEIGVDKLPLLHESAQEDAAGIVFGIQGLVNSCMLMRSGELQCRGSNDVGQLGDGTLQQRDWFCRAHDMNLCRIPLPLPVISVSVGSIHSCAVVTHGAVCVIFKRRS